MEDCMASQVAVLVVFFVRAPSHLRFTGLAASDWAVEHVDEAPRQTAKKSLMRGVSRRDSAFRRQNPNSGLRTALNLAGLPSAAKLGGMSLSNQPLWGRFLR